MNWRCLKECLELGAVSRSGTLFLGLVLIAWVIARFGYRWMYLNDRRTLPRVSLPQCFGIVPFWGMVVKWDHMSLPTELRKHMVGTYEITTMRDEQGACPVHGRRKADSPCIILIPRDLTPITRCDQCSVVTTAYLALQVL